MICIQIHPSVSLSIANIYKAAAEMQKYEEAEDNVGAKFPIYATPQKSSHFNNFYLTRKGAILFANMPSCCSDSSPPLPKWQSSGRTASVVKQ